MPKKAKSEWTNFQMAPSLLADVIQRQTGTLTKAIVEGIISSVAAGATQCEIALDQDVLLITVNGRVTDFQAEIWDFGRCNQRRYAARRGVAAKPVP